MPEAFGNIAKLLAVNAFYLQIISGTAIVAAAAFDRWQGRCT